jgi:transposase
MNFACLFLNIFYRKEKTVSKKNIRKLNIRTHIFMPEEIEKLKECRDRQKDHRLKIRFTSLLLIADNVAVSSVAGAVGKSVRTAEQRYNIYIAGGPDALNSFHYQPKQCYLTDGQTEELAARVKENHPSDTKAVCHYIREQFGAAYSRSAVEKLLKKQGPARLRPRLIPGNPPSEKEQELFSEEYKQLRESAADPDSGTVIIFCDALHFIHQTVAGKYRGDPGRRTVFETNSGRQRLNIIGGYNPVTGGLIHESDENPCNAVKSVIFFEKILKAYPKADRITVILDNARYFHAKKVRELTEKHPRLSLRFLPPYAPNLNLIERLRRFAKEKLVKNTYYAKYKTFRCHVFRFLNSLSQYKKELSSLMTEKFQIIRYDKQ